MNAGSELVSVPLAGVVGAPIAQSKSPQLHGHWLTRYGIKGFYVPLEVSPADFETVIQAMPRMGFVGTNVTIPHKEAALRLADEVTERARLIGAANTLTFRADGSIHADNTDGYGFLANLKSGAPAWKAENGAAFILGAGGAARAVIVSLHDAGVAEITISNRTRARAETLADELNIPLRIVDWSDAGDATSEAALLVNSTSLGMIGKAPLSMSLDALRSDSTVTDLVYNPLQTPLLTQAAERGATTVDGLGMLLHQAVPGFERWFGRRPEVDQDLRDALLA